MIADGGLFEVVNGVAVPSIHAIMIDPYKSLWEKDKTEDKMYAVKLFTYIEFLCSVKKSNPFGGYSSITRGGAIKERLWGDKNYQHPFYTVAEIVEAIEFYNKDIETSSPGYELYVSALVGAEKSKNFIDTFDPNERTRTGILVLKPADYNKALIEVPTTIKKLKEARNTLIGEIEETSKTRKERQVGRYER